jgi:hypothetical protein
MVVMVFLGVKRLEDVFDIGDGYVLLVSDF